MPAYDYQCRDCGYKFEEFQSMTAELLVTCPSCGKPGLKRLMAGGVGMIFKGSGFYQTDYKKRGSSSSTSPPSSDSSKSDKKSDPSSTSDPSKSNNKPSSRS